MTHRDNTYEINELKSNDSLKYFFVSRGVIDVIKVVEYQYVRDLNNAQLFNLGFGDYNIELDTIDDTSNTNNTDHYQVFHTVLNTVPKFFHLNPNAIMVVQGSDNSESFVRICRATCRKKCTNNCRNLNRRIKAYRYFLKKNYEQLKTEYFFLGGIRTENGIELDDVYNIVAAYDLVFCKKKLTL